MSIIIVGASLLFRLLLFSLTIIGIKSTSNIFLDMSLSVRNGSNIIYKNIL